MQNNTRFRLLLWFLSKMRTVLMCFSIFHVPKCRVCSLAKFWKKSFHSLDETGGYSSNFTLHSSKANELEGGYRRRFIRRPLSTKPEGRNEITQSRKSTMIRHEVLDETISTSAILNINRTEVIDFQNFQYCDIQQKIAENKDLIELVTIMAFDIETTGFGREKERIIELAAQDLSGGENSTFQSLVNPERIVPNSHVHGITTHMVCRPGVPTMEELSPVFLQFLRSRLKPGGCILLVAHNARTFDVPFLLNELNRCSIDMPPYVRFLDTMPLTRRWIKSELLKGSDVPSKKTLQALGDFFRIPSVGSAHRAMSDVRLLSLILQRLSYKLKMSIPDLLQESFTVSDLSSTRKKN